MIHFHHRILYHQFSVCSYLQAEIYVVQRYLKLLIESSNCIKRSFLDHQAGSRHSADILDRFQSSGMLAVFSFRSRQDMTGKAAHTDNNTAVLYRVVRVIQFCADNSGILSLAIAQHIFHPLRCDHFDIVVHQNIVIAGCKRCTVIIDRRIVEALLPVNHLYIRIAELDLVIIGEGILFGTVVFNDNDLKILPG